MKTNKLLTATLLLFLTLFLAACGTSESDEPDAGNGSTEEVTEEVTESEAPAVLKQLENNLYQYTVNNDTDETMNFDFTSGQRFDYTISNEQGEELHRESAVSMYTQELGEATIEPGDALEYEFEIPPLELDPGVYLIKAWFTPQDGPQFEAETEHTVE